jgi:conjugative relaxase-like TrwC/TraI family protein
MLSPKTQYSLTNAEAYFAQHLCVGDYYSQSQSIRGQWFGKGAESLGLHAEVGQADFVALCRNTHPETGAKLTQSQKDRRIECDENGVQSLVANRRVFYDFTISAPKAVSILALIGTDARIQQAHVRATEIAMAELEHFVGTRVRRGGKSEDRETGNFVGAMFHHDTSRALDPHLHSHCILFNATFDPIEKRWKALQNYEMLRAQKYTENVYYHELARTLIGFGYQIENNRRGDFEVKGVPKELCDRFSKRHAQIEKSTRELLVAHPEKAAGNIRQIREYIAQTTRVRKIKDPGSEKLLSLWNQQISREERIKLYGLHLATNKPAQTQSVQAALTWAEQHVFERRSVVDEHELWRHALEFARGSPIDIGDLKAFSKTRDYIRNFDKPGKVSTREVLSREWTLIQMAKTGVEKFGRFNADYIPIKSLETDQRIAVSRILCSRDFVTLFRGAAGTGKSFALREVLSGLKEAGYDVQVLAPQRQQTVDLENSGLAGAKTVSEFLIHPTIKEKGVVILDEAGLLDSTQMLTLMQCVQANNGRMICSGDTRQHGAIGASDALRAIEKYSGLRSVQIETIRRQDPTKGKSPKERDFIKEYKLAVQEASSGLEAASFARLEKLGAVVECPPGKQQETVALHFVEIAKRQESVLVVAQTWSEIDKLNDEIRTALKTAGVLAPKETVVKCLQLVDLTGAQKRDVRSYEPGCSLVFNRNANGIQKQQPARLVGVTQKGIVVQSGNRIRLVSFENVDRFSVCKEREIALAVGDRLQLKANAKTKEGHQLLNGEIVTVAKVGASGRITLGDGRIIDGNYRQFVRGYAVTSYASQGKTVDHVLFSDSASKAATSQQQWYVTISRGRKSVRIFTKDKAQLRENISRTGERTLAVELASPTQTLRRVQTRQQKRLAAQRQRIAHAAIKARAEGKSQGRGMGI